MALTQIICRTFVRQSVQLGNRISRTALTKSVILESRHFSVFHHICQYKDDFFDNPRHHHRHEQFAALEPEALAKKLRARDWSKVHMSDVNRDVYEPDHIVEERTDDEVEAFRAENEIIIVDGAENAPKPVFTLSEAGFPKAVVNQMTQMGFQKPMPVQAQGWPIALSSLDLVAIGQTGSGKTLGYLLPAIVHILKQKRQVNRHSPIALVLAPTRELAQQINDVMVKFGRSTDVKSVCCFGGSGKHFQIERINAGVDMIIATPGRLIDLAESGVVNFEDTSYVVLDEADRMLDMGFEPQIKAILGQVRPDRQMLMWSATWPEEVQGLARQFFGEKKYVHLNIGSIDLHANHNIMQIVRIVRKEDKLRTLIDYLKSEISLNDRVLIFADTKRSVDFVTNRLLSNGFRAQGIHGDKSQRQRENTLRSFRNGRLNIMVATNVAARGLDVDDISTVINFDYPTNSEDYVHRIGRTGRRNQSGTALTLFTEEEASQSKELVKVLKEANQDVPQQLLEWSKRKFGKSQFQKSRDSFRPMNSYRFQRGY